MFVKYEICFTYLNTFVKKTVHHPDEVLEGQALEDPPDPVHVDPLRSVVAAVPHQMTGCRFLKQWLKLQRLILFKIHGSKLEPCSAKKAK